MQSTIDAKQVLKDIWGYDSFRPLQAESVDCVLHRRDSVTVLPTGGGKSICYQAPALCLDGMAVVVSPLISLMKDQVDALRACGVEAAFANSTQSPDEKRKVVQQIRAGTLKLLYVAPERLLTEQMLTFLQSANVSCFAIDEAHCISNWGHDFRPEYRGLRTLKERFPGLAVHAFTATATESVRDDIVAQLALDQPKVLVGSFDRPNLVYRMLAASNRSQQILDVIKRHPNESGIIYCISRKEVESMVELLQSMGHSALAYHAGMSDIDRKSNQEAFINDQCNIIVATVAFGMGIDKSNVRYVIHSGMPKSIEHYQQESGRAGRDGLESECVLIYSGRDIVVWSKMLSDGNSEFNEAAKESLEAINRLCTSATCRHRSIVEHFGQKFDKENCGGCDVCLGEIEMMDDPITLSQKILSCVVRVNERFGAGHVAKVLAGATEQRVIDLGHDKLSTYGLLRESGVRAIRLWIDQLTSQGFLRRESEYQTLSLTDAGKRLLRRDGAPQLSFSAAATSRTKSSRTTSTLTSWEGVDRELFDDLRRHRAQIASELNVPAYIVFNDATLRDLARFKPSTQKDFGNIRGVGQQKAERYAEGFLALIAIRPDRTDIGMRNTTPSATTVDTQNSNSFRAFPMFQRGESIEQVAASMERATSTIWQYLQDFLRFNEISDCSPWVDPAICNRVLSQKALASQGKLKPLYEHFNGEIGYEQLRIVLICDQISSQQ